MATPIQTCATHGQSTRISCVDCGTPICPKCLVRTEVGTKCASCAAPVPERVTTRRRSRLPWIAAGLVALVVVVVAAVVIGGGGGARTVAARPVGTWVRQAGLNRIRGTTAVVTLPNGNVLAAGGGVGALPVASAEIYNPKTGTWSLTGSLLQARRGAKAVVLGNGQVLLAGGIAGSRLLSSAELYNPGSGRWTPTGSMTVPRLDDTLTLLPGGEVLAAGGTSSGGHQGAAGGQTISPTATAELYDPSTGRWTPTGSMTTARFEATATSLSDGRVLIAGGLGASLTGAGAAAGQYAPLASAEIYDPAVGVFTGAGHMNEARANQVAAPLPGGTVLVAGGRGGPGGTVSLSSAERFDPRTGAWSELPPMAVAPSGATATVVAGGDVLVAGGESVDGGIRTSLTAAELYQPASDTWVSAGAMSCPRSGQGAAALGGGGALVVAGDAAFPGQPPVAQGCVDRYYSARKPAHSRG